MAQQSTRIIAVVALLAGSLVGAGLVVAAIGPAAPGTADATGGDGGTEGDVATVEQFGNESAFQRYVERGRSLRGASATTFARAGSTTARQGGGDGGDGAAGTAADVERERAPQTVEATRTPMETAQPATEAEAADGGPDRVGRTNVQVEALDEPDVVKTDGSTFYYAPQFRGDRAEPRPRDQPWDGDTTQPPRPAPETHVLDIDDPASPETVANIDETGQLLQTGDRLLVLGDEELSAYDVSDPENPEAVWSQPLEDHLVTARERNGTVYLVTRSHVGGSPCPIEPLGPESSIPCGDVYRPDAQVAVDATYSAFTLDADDGEIQDSVSFVGTGDNSAVYMSTESLYVTYTSRTNRASLVGDFLSEEFDQTPERVEQRIEEVRSYDISPESREREIRRAVQQWLDSLPDEKRDEIQRNLSEGMRTYVADHQRELTETGIVQVDVTDAQLSVETTGTVPGRPLNQFSLSEHEGTLRVATTVPRAGDAESVNDLYVLDSDSLSTIGSVTDMGEGQEIYAVRYVGETAYLVTFRQVDPLHVVDLSEPTDPVERGELELPGFSSYLHPIDDDHVLGVGEEDGEVKAVLFDVSDPENPTVADDEILDARWSAVSQSHHAFTIDRRHGVFFLPTGQEGVVMDYTNGSLSVEHTVDTHGTPERARYVDDYLYVFAGTEVAVLDETDWDRVDTLDLLED